MQTKPKVRFISKDKNLFFATVKKRVDAYFEENHLSKNANAAMIIKTTILLLGYLVPFICFWVFQPSLGVSLLLWVIMGFSVAGIGMSVMHDANHGAYSASERVNYILGHTLNLLGGSVINWKLQHNVLHHTFTNITHLDEDIDDKAILRFSPHTLVKPIMKFQWVYALLVYGIVTLYWVFVKDFMQFQRYIRKQLIVDTPAQKRLSLLKIILAKAAYLFVFLFAPTIFGGIPFLTTLLGFLAMHVVAGVVLTVVFQLAHTVEGTLHPMPDEKGTIEMDWAVHQMHTTVNFSRYNKWISWYVGGLNFQVEHHLFPKICHIHYPKISQIVKDTAAEFGVPYLENKTFWQAFRSHIATLKRFGKMPDLAEVIG